MELCALCKEPVEKGERFCANCGASILSGSDASQEDKFYAKNTNSPSEQDLIDSLQPLDENPVYTGPEDILLHKKQSFKSIESNNVAIDQNFIDNLEPLDENEVHESSNDDFTPRSLFVDEQKQKSSSIKSLRKRTLPLTIVLVLNYLIIAFLGVFSIYEILHDLMVSSILFIFIGYAVLLVKWVQDLDNKARFILVALILLELLGSIFYANIIILVLALFQMYVLLLDRKTVELFKSPS